MVKTTNNSKFTYRNRNNGTNRNRRNRQNVGGKKPSNLTNVAAARLCTPEASKNYWEALRDFLNASGVVARTWHLYEQVKNDPEPQTLRARIDQASNASARLMLEAELKAVLGRQTVMQEKQNCRTKEELLEKAEREGKDYRAKLEQLLSYSLAANLRPTCDVNENLKRKILYAFFSLDEKVRGSCRRDYYRTKYANPSLKRIEKSGYSEPISIFEIENHFRDDIDWQERFLRKKRKT